MYRKEDFNMFDGVDDDFDLTLHKKMRLMDRKPNSKRIFYVAGGCYLTDTLDTFESFNIDDNIWTSLPNLPIPRSGLGLAFLKGAVYAVGGRKRFPDIIHDSSAWVHRYDPVVNFWQSCTTMIRARHRVGLCVMDDLLYACGGSTGPEVHKSVERYNPDLDAWAYTMPMNQKRMAMGVAVIDRLLYVVGGYDGENQLKSVECYNPDTNSWVFVSDMNECKSGAGVAALGHHIYVVGGYNGLQQLYTVERYDTHTNMWEFCRPLSIARSALSLVVISNKLYAIGGYDGRNLLSLVEVYDPWSDIWSQSMPMIGERSGHASTVYQHQSSIPSKEPAMTPQYMSQPSTSKQQGFFF